MLRRALTLVLGLALLAGCTTEPGGFGPPPPVSPTEEPTPSVSPTTPEPARDVRVATPGYRYEPAVVELAPGESVVLVLHNPDSRAHTLTINELSLQMTANAGETVRLPVQAPEEGSFVMFCSISGHLEAGHRGRLEVR